MNVYARFDEIPSMTFKVIKKTKRNGRTDGRTDGQCENSIPSHKHSLQGVNNRLKHYFSKGLEEHKKQEVSLIKRKVYQGFRIL